MRDYKWAVYIGRFQPFHNGHLAVIRHGLEIADNVIVVVGSCNAAPNIRNPFSFDERKAMITASVHALPERPGWTGVSPLNNVHVVGVRDYYYSENTWVSEVQAKTDKFIEDGDPVALLGDYKDSSSYYLNYFPQWTFEPVNRTVILKTNLHTAHLNATNIRELLFREDIATDWEGKPTENPERYTVLEKVRNIVPAPVGQRLAEWVKTPAFAKLAKEWHFINDYKSKWASAPFPPTFLTADAIVVCSGHVLVVRRGGNPGKGLLALPGGFVKQNEHIRDGALRELREETRIKVDKLILESSIEGEHVFDNPERSLRGRTISHGFYIKLKDGKLPEVKAADDAAEAFWLPLMDVGRREHEFFEDHAHIIHYFMNWS